VKRALRGPDWIRWCLPGIRCGLRAGFLTSAGETGADVLAMMEVSRHRRVETLQGYVRRANLFKSFFAACYCNLRAPSTTYSRFERIQTALEFLSQ
jgi:hypothetical protein